MVETFKFEGNIYRVSDLSKESKKIHDYLNFTIHRLNEFNATIALLMCAKNAYISDLKGEIIERKSGLDLGALFSDD